MLAFRLFPFVQAIIILCFFIYPIEHLNKKVKWALAIILGLSSLKIYTFVLTGGTMMDPNLTRTLSIILNTLYFTSIFVFLLTVIRMGINGLFKLIKKDKTRFIIPAKSSRYALTFLVLSFLIACKGIYNGFDKPVLTEYQIEIANLPIAADNFKIVQLSDLHICLPTRESDIENIVDRVNRLNPDLIVITGDLIDGEVEALEPKTKILFNLKAKYGVYGVSGNHEFYSGYQEWVDYFTNGGIPFLENKTVIIKDESGTPLFNLAGLIDKAAERFDMTEPDVEAVKPFLDKNIPSIFLAHQPKLCLDLEDLSALTLSGHTHGGMMPGLATLIKSANGGLVSGYYKLGNEQVIVSNGTQIWAGVPLRIGILSQINLITLKSK